MTKKKKERKDQGIFEIDPKRISKILSENITGRKRREIPPKNLESLKDGFSWGHKSGSLNPILDFDEDIAFLTVILFPKESLPHEYTIQARHSTGKVEKIKAPLPLMGTIPEPLMRWPQEGICEFLFDKPSVDPVKLFDDIVDIFKDYIYFDKDEIYPLLTLWIMGTYLFPLFPSYPFFLLNGPFASGKSRTTKLASYLCFNSCLLTSPNEAVIYRYVDTYRSSLFFDNAEWLSRTKYTRLTDTLNSSYKKGAKVPRLAGSKKGPPTEFEIYSPKMFNNTTGAETILASRSIIVNQIRASKSVKIKKNEPTGEEPIWEDLRNRLYLFMFRYWKQIEKLIAKQNIAEIAGRDHELFVGILSIAQLLDKLAGSKKLHKTILDFAVKQADERKNEYLAHHPEALVMQALLSVVDGDGWYSVHRIAEEIQKYHLKDDKLTDAWVGRILNGMGIGKTKGTWRRAVEAVKNKEKKLTQYNIKRRQVEELARKYGIPKNL